MQTASFFTPGIDLDDPRLCCIARGHPPQYHGRCYLPLAPSWAMIGAYRTTGDMVSYTEAYREERLSGLEPAKVVVGLGEDTILLCWEPAGRFCHRRLVAAWLESALGVAVPEWGGSK